MAKSRAYWKKRFEKLEDETYRKSQAYYEDLQKQFRRATNEIEMQISSWYYRLADNNGISYSLAKRYLNRKELKEFRWTVEEYIKYGRENALNQKWMKELENASIRVHISRLEAMKLQMQQQIERLFVEYEGGVSDFLSKTFQSTYYGTAYEIFNGTGIGTNLHALESNVVNNILRKPWAQDGKDFSSRIWSNKEHLVQALHTELTQHLVRGTDPGRAITAIAKRMGVSRSQAGNLVMTESAAIHSMAQQQCYKDLDVEEFEIVATLDTKTSEFCREMDGEHFPMTDYMVNVTAPPFHCRCRTCTCPYFDDEFTSEDERAYRGADGNTGFVRNMNYQEWYDKYVASNTDAKLKEIKEKNFSADKKQYENYQRLLGKEHLPNSFDEFQRVKYADETEYGILKAQACGMTYYNKAIANEPLITAHIEGVAKQADMNVLGLDKRIKDKDSYLRKIRANYNPNVVEYEINDIIRYTYGAGPGKLADRTLKSMSLHSQLGYDTIKVKNSWTDPDNPYSGVNTIIKAPGGQKFELQYHTQESFDLKNGQLHELYEKQRIIKDTSCNEYIELNDQMFDLSDKLEIPINIKAVRNK
jgi:SPP1 gp7 family putative phage head morphogenesis protein